MAYRTLYRVFRPVTFDEVYGQQHITDILKKQVETKKAAHAYLFCGPRGTGKTSTAKIFANALNCLAPQNGNPCGKCEVCTSFANDAFVDIVEIDAASNNGVDNVRDIREKVSLLPAQGKYKIYIIDEVHMLSTGAFNALLKTLEEPPAHAVFILATTEIRKVPATILSRCQKYDFKRITDEDIIARLAYVAQQTGVVYEQEALELIAQQAEGAMRDALSIMDQCIAGSDSLTKDAVLESVGIADTVAVRELVDAILTENAAHALLVSGKMTGDGVTAHNILRDLIRELSVELAKRVQDAYQCANILRSLEVLIGVQNTLRYSNVPNAVLSAAIVRATVNTTDVELGDVELRIRKLEDRVERLSRADAVAVVEAHEKMTMAEKSVAEQSVVQKQTEKQAVQLVAKPAEKPMQKEAAKANGDLSTSLQKFKDGIMIKNMALFPAANMVMEIKMQGNVLELYAAKEDAPLVDMLVSASNESDVTAVVEEVFGVSFTLRIVCTDAPQEDQTDMQQELIELFGAENVDIKE